MAMSRTRNKLNMSSASLASELLHHAVPSQSPCGSTEPLVTFLTFFMFSITPDVVTLSPDAQLHRSTVYTVMLLQREMQAPRAQC
ncbi:hypothetical protein CB1_000576068 [Camelus ferus]|nr:hypothetical protein CB1_000576068 [Camelus ferus]